MARDVTLIAEKRDKNRFGDRESHVRVEDDLFRPGLLPTERNVTRLQPSGSPTFATLASPAQHSLRAIFFKRLQHVETLPE
jgi:hypothetical protein